MGGTSQVKLILVEVLPRIAGMQFRRHAEGGRRRARSRDPRLVTAIALLAVVKPF